MSKISIGTKSYGPDSSSIEIKGLTREEADQLLGSIRGHSWFTVEDGRLKVAPRHEPLPDPTQDEGMLPFWRKFEHHQPQGELVARVFEEMSADAIYEPHFAIQSLCGYNYSRENYAIESEKLTSYGFTQMRSKRAEDGSYWEIWYLPGVWFAKGDLKEVIDKITSRAKSWEDPHGKRKKRECFEAVLEFIRRNVSFGTLDVSIQRMCAVMGD